MVHAVRDDGLLQRVCIYGMRLAGVQCVGGDGGVETGDRAWSVVHAELPAEVGAEAVLDGVCDGLEWAMAARHLERGSIIEGDLGVCARVCKPRVLEHAYQHVHLVDIGVQVRHMAHHVPVAGVGHWREHNQRDVRRPLPGGDRRERRRFRHGGLICGGHGD